MNSRTETTQDDGLFVLTYAKAVGNMCKAICGVAAGACGGAINLHWAKGSDISDIQAKFGAQVRRPLGGSCSSGF